jgi:hypothetical protein
MVGEIEQLNLSVSELSGDNSNIKSVLVMKQNEWTNVDQKTKKSSKPAVNTENLIHFKYLMWKNQVLAMTKILKKPITQGDHLRTQLVVESFQNSKARD